MKKKKSSKYRYLVNFIIAVAIILLVDYISSFVFFRIDLTSEKRYTLSDVTKEILGELEDVFYIKIYLEGDMPVGFQRMNKAIKELLDEFRIYANENIQYEFINPSKKGNEEERNKFFAELYNKGIKPTNVHVNEEDGATSEKIIFPGALVVFNNIEFPLNLLKNNPGLPAEINLNNSIQSLEYEFIKAIKNLNTTTISKIAFIEGHDELSEPEVGDITRELANYYQVDRGVINGKLHILDEYKVVIIAKPMKKFSEADKLVIDQYLMKGGKILWCIDIVNVNTDSLAMGRTFGFINSLNLDDQFFKYGVRLNPILVKDFQCAILPVNTALEGNPARFVPMQWVYYPLVYPSDEHPITKNVNMVKLEFPGSIDTVGAGSTIRKTFLLTSSAYSKIVHVPAMISLEEIKESPRKEEYRNSFQNMAVLMEGSFESVFKNRMLDNIIPGSTRDYHNQSVPTKMIVVTDGDVIRNDVRYTAQGPLITPIGYDKYSNQTFGNKELILNMVNYLTDESGLMSLRGREFKLRLLDRSKIKDKELKWKTINTIIPILFVILFGMGYTSFRRRKYTKP